MTNDRAGKRPGIGAMARTLGRYAWAAPATLVGMAFTACVLALGGRARVVDGVIEAFGGALGTLLAARRAPFCAITLGHVVLALDDAKAARCRAHEHVHVRQYERWGALFFVAYLGSSAWQAMRGGRAYRDNRFELEARRVAGH